jgi:hypothetical protein
VRQIVQDIQAKINHILRDDAVFVCLVLILVGVTSFGLGRNSVTTTAADSSQTATAQDARPATAAPRATTATPAGAGETETQYVASRNSDKYHLPWCSGAKRIGEANKIYFSSKAEAEAAGYQPAANCPGI